MSEQHAMSCEYPEGCSCGASRINRLIQRAENDGFIRGYVCAVATIIRTHGGGVIAKDVLRAVGNVDWATIDPSDRDVLAKAGIAPRANKGAKS